MDGSEEQQVRRLFDRQQGLATVDQLVELGLRRETVRERIHRRDWRLVLPRVVCRDARPLDAELRLLAALLMAGQGAMIGSWSAANWHGLRATSRENKVVVVIPADRLVRPAGFVIVRRTRRLDAAAVHTATVAVSSAPRAVADAARELGGTRARELVLEAVQRRLVTLDDLRHELEAGPRQGSKALRGALAEAEHHAWSVPEAELAAVVAGSHTLPPMWANPSLTVNGVRLPTPDGWFDDVALAVQVHSKRYHAGELDWEKTVSADGVYAEHGIPLVAVTPRQIATQPEAVLSRVQRAYEQAAGRPRPMVTAVPLDPRPRDASRA